MPRRLMALLCLATASCAEALNGPEGPTTFVLQRVGDRPLPTWLASPADAWVIVAESLVLPAGALRQEESFVITRTQVHQDTGQLPAASRERYRAQVVGKTLVVDTCPLGAFCIAGLVYDPFTLSVDGDSLREIPREGATWPPRVYGRLAPSSRPR